MSVLQHLSFARLLKRERKAPRLVTTHLGVWEVVQECESWLQIPGGNIVAGFNELRASLPYLFRFFNDIFALGPWLLVIYISTSVWASLEPTISLYYSSRLLNVIQARIQGPDVNASILVRAITEQILCTILTTVISQAGKRNEGILSDRIKYHFMERSMMANLKVDMPTSQDPHVKLNNPPSFDCQGPAWNAVERLMSKITRILDITSQSIFLLGVMRQQSAGPSFVLICVIQPLLRFFAEIDLWSISHIYFSNNPFYRRMQALYNLSKDDGARQDIINDDAGQYIRTEFHKARFNLGDTCTVYPHRQWRARTPVLWKMASDVGYDLPLVFLALRSLHYPSSFSASSISILQQTAQSIRWSITSIFYDSLSTSAILNVLKRLYTATEVENRIIDGDLPYLTPEKKLTPGMEIEFRKVYFAYPGTVKNALSNVSFSINPGQLAVIVGVNGSGKSSLIKLFSRLYDPTDGQIFIDGLPLSSYKLADIRRSMAILNQEHRPYPLSLGENVALGLPDRTVSDDDINRAVRMGGAYNFIQKLPDRLDTILEPVKTAHKETQDDHDKTLNALLEGKEAVTAISGGETQRLAASRTFMRIDGGNIRFLAADEPTSALDPEGEFELFRRLRQEGAGKTMVFITHRFGHLTKHADVILCMKDGCLVEQGTHEELISKRGEYFRLHDIQAKAFLPESISRTQGDQ